MLIQRCWSMPNKWTFKIKPIRELLEKYAVGKGWVDPFAGMYSPAEYTNDISKKAIAESHCDAAEFLQGFPDGNFVGGLFDPPYSAVQVAFSYDGSGSNLYKKNTEAERHFFTIKREFIRVIRVGGVTITFAWNSNGMGKTKGFEIIEILLVPHGCWKNDTIVVVERKVCKER